MNEKKGEQNSHPVNEWWVDATQQLEAISAHNLQRSLWPSGMAVGNRIQRGGRVLWNFSSNNYLDLATHPTVVTRAREALERYGAGAGGSRLITGSLDLHETLEARLATFKGTEAALVFSSGYLANLGVIGALSWRADGSRVPIFFDRLAHASIVDAVMLSRAPWRTFPHNDVEALERHLKRVVGNSVARQKPSAVVVTEGVFSMDGDVAPITELQEICERWGALLVVDDAHGTGVVGPNGAGVVQWLGLSGAPNLVQVATLSKAFGTQGGFVAGPSKLREFLVNRARAFIFDTALAPPCVGAALGALEVLEQEPERVATLRELSALLRRLLWMQGFSIPESPAAIVPLVVGDAARTLELAAALEAQDYLVVGIRPPTVPPGTSRLRITLMCSHPREAVEGLVQAIATNLAPQLSRLKGE
ncbi:MAG: 8-amino-7-oxononanoate synthase [Candidatus Hydrogenedentota bacterium]|jgi:8-amino-7-oxononanoate synthase|nr:MAG: 8-amino-7-oxononanoate synthase [Candidatus Hydrogenedentota bacterium]